MNAGNVQMCFSRVSDNNGTHSGQGCCGPVMADTGSGQLTDSKQRSHILEGLMRGVKAV